jgi:hypothetical protein
MSIIDETRNLLSSQRDKLQEERAKLVDQRDAITKQIEEIDSFLDQLPGAAPRVRTTPTGRRSGIRDRVLETIHAHPEGMTAAQVRAAIGLTDKAGSQSVSNALSALKKDGKLIQTETGAYKGA